jgi:hypothetical protein
MERREPVLEGIVALDNIFGGLRLCRYLCSVAMRSSSITSVSRREGRNAPAVVVIEFLKTCRQVVLNDIHSLQIDS